MTLLFLQEVETNLEMIFSNLDVEKCNSTTHCYVCEEPLVEGQRLARDHNHFTG